jgi:hypothetical protein
MVIEEAELTVTAALGGPASARTKKKFLTEPGLAERAREIEPEFTVAAAVVEPASAGTEKKFLTEPELAERAQEIKHLVAAADEHRKRDAVKIGQRLQDVHDRIEEAKTWGKFCRQAGVSRRKADMYRFIAASEVAPLLRGVKFSVCLLLARFALRSQDAMTAVLDLLRNEDVTALTIRDLEARLGIAPPPKSDAWEKGFAAGMQVGEAHGFAAVRLGLDLSDLRKPNLPALAQEHYDRLVKEHPDQATALKELLAVITQEVKNEPSRY